MSARWYAVLITIVIVAVGCYFGWPEASEASIDPQLKARFESEQKPLVQKLLASDSNLERLQLVGQLQKTIADLTEAQRRELFEYARKHSPDLRDAFIAREQSRFEKFFQLPPGERTAALDKHIDEMESMRTMFAGFRPGGANGPPVSPPTSDATGADRDFRRQQRAQEMLNNTTPEFRAQMSDYMDQLNERRKERGLPVMRPPGT